MNWIPKILTIAGAAVVLTGVVMMLIGWVRFMIAAFTTSVLWGLGCLLVPFCKLFYLIMHWEEAKSGFFLYMKGFVVLFLGGMLAAVIVPNIERARIVTERVRAREHLAAGQSANDPSDTNSIEKNSTAATSSHQTLRLQAIVYSDTRPSAMINGNMVFVGDKVSGWSVTAISTKTVTLQNGSGETNTLALK